MAFNLNTSRKPENLLYKKVIDEVIEMYGITVKYLYVEKMNKNEVFRDFSHLSIHPDVISKEIYLLPENSEDWEGDVVYNNFGFYNQWTQTLYISRKTILELYPDFDEDGRSRMVNNLIITPSSTVLEITHVETYNPGINNLWGYADRTSVYKLSVKIYDHNIADEGISDIGKEVELDIKLKEGANSLLEDENTEVIFEHDEELDTTDIDKFFQEITQDINTVEDLADKGDDKGKKPSNTNSPFGNLS
jgi:hypothetical protein